MATVIRPDEIDFGAYLDMTDSAHKVVPASVFCDQVVEKFLGKEETKGAMLPWAKTHEQFRVRPGEVTLWSGWNSHKKSMLLGQVIIALNAQDEKVCIASLEMRPDSTLHRMTKQACGTDEPSVPRIREFHAWTDNRLWLYNHLGSLPWQKMVAVCRYCADQLSLKHIVIDSLMKCGIVEDDYNGQKQFVDQLCVVARDTGIHIHLVAHAKKSTDEDTPPGKMDTKGNGTMLDLVDNVIVVWANKKKDKEKAKVTQRQEVIDQPDQLLIVEKQRHGEFEGRIALWFHEKSLQFLEREKAWPTAYIDSQPSSVAA